MSYYNQPDHELIDRRDEAAKQVLLRLARSTTSVGLSRPQVAEIHDGGAVRKAAPDSWSGRLRDMGLPPHDAEPLALAGGTVQRVWRDHYAAAFVGSADEVVIQQLRNRGFEVVLFDESETEWAIGFTRLAAALGRVS